MLKRGSRSYGQDPIRGYVHSWYKTEKAQVYYHVFIVTEDQIDPSLWKGVYREDEIAPAPITWRAINTADAWWIKHALYYIDNMRSEFLYWPEPEGGWQPGHLVSVPFDSDNTRQLARVVDCWNNEGRKRITVEFPVVDGRPETLEEAVREDYPADYISGPHIHWTLPLYKFHQKSLKRKLEPVPDDAAATSKAPRLTPKESPLVESLGLPPLELPPQLLQAPEAPEAPDAPEAPELDVSVFTPEAPDAPDAPELDVSVFLKTDMDTD